MLDTIAPTLDHRGHPPDRWEYDTLHSPDGPLSPEKLNELGAAGWIVEAPVQTQAESWFYQMRRRVQVQPKIERR